MIDPRSNATDEPTRGGSLGFLTRRAAAWFEGALVFAVLLAAGGDPPPHRNEAHYLARLKHFWDAEWCEADLFLQTPDAHFTVVWLFGWVTLFLSLETTAWVGRLLSWALIAWGWTRLSRRLAPHPLMAPLTAALLVVLTEQTHFAGEWIVGGFEAKCVAYGFVLLALREAIDHRWNRAWVLLGAASAFHVLVGGWSVVALFAVWATRRPIRPRPTAMLPGLLAGGALAMLGVAPALALNDGVSPQQAADANVIYVFGRLSHHLAPLSKPPVWIAERGLRWAIGLGLLFALHRSLLGPTASADSVARPRRLRMLVAFAAASVAISAAGFAIEIACGSDRETAAALLRYYFFRLADIAPAIASSVLIGAAVGRGIARRKPWAPRAAVVCVVVGVVGVGQHAVSRLADPVPAAEARMRSPRDWAAMCDWVEANAAADAVVLVPMMSHSFKWRTNRAEVVAYKDVPQNAAGLLEWRRRLCAVFQIDEWPDGSPRWAPSVAHLGAARLRELADEFGAQYALDEASPRAAGLPGRYRASLPVLHRVGPYTLYDLRHAR